MTRKDTVKLQFTGPVTSNTPYGQMAPGDTTDVEREQAEDEVKRNPRLWKIEGQDENPVKKKKGGKK